MGRLSLAIRILFNGAFAAQIRRLQETPALTDESTPQEAAKQEPPPAPKRNDAVTLLATLQREARLVDFLMETLDGYSDAQVGAAVRNVHRDSRGVLDRLFDIHPVLKGAEGSDVELGDPTETGRIRLTGDAADQQPSQGKLVHHGWEAARCELPKWSGSDSAAQVLAPAEVDVSLSK